MKIVSRRFVTLIEMMIVITLIIMIVGVIAWNVQGSLDEGKAFKTKTGMEKLETVLEIMLANNPSLEDRIEEEWPRLIQSSPLIKNPQDLTKDGWGADYEVTVEDGRVRVHSENFDRFVRENPTSVIQGVPEE